MEEESPRNLNKIIFSCEWFVGGRQSPSTDRKGCRKKESYKEAENGDEEAESNHNKEENGHEKDKEIVTPCCSIHFLKMRWETCSYLKSDQKLLSPRDSAMQ